MPAPRTVTIRNKRKRPITINIPAVKTPELSVRVQAGVRQGNVPVVRGRKAYSPASSVPKPAIVDKRVSGSITLTAAGTLGGVQRGLPASVLKSPDVIAMRKQGVIDVDIVVRDSNAHTGHKQPAPSPRGRSATQRPGGLDKEARAALHAAAVKRREEKIARATKTPKGG